MSIQTQAAAALREDRKVCQIEEAKVLLNQIENHEYEIRKLKERLDELDSDADPINMDGRIPGDQIKIILGRQFIKR